MQGDFRITRRVQFVETDLAGVMHFSNYLRWMEDVEHAFWRSLGLSVRIMGGSSHVSWPRASVTCDYLAPVTFEEELELRFRVTHVGVKSLQYAVEFRRGEDMCALARATTVCCVVENGTFRSIAIPADIKERIASVFADTVGARGA